MKIICISGKAQHGKDTLACMIKEKTRTLGYRTLIAHYGDLVKYVCKAFFDWNGEKDEEGRTLLQLVGTNIVREKDPDYWVKFIKEMLTFFNNKWDFVIIPDCRFPNEIEVIRDTKQTVYACRIERPCFSNGLTEEQQRHLSEIALDDYCFDFYVVNNSDLVALEQKAKDVLEAIL